MQQAQLCMLNTRQLACQILDNVNQVMKFMIHHFVQEMSAKGKIQSDGYFKGFDLKKVMIFVND